MEMDPDLESLRYPIGRLNLPDEITEEQLNKRIQTIDSFPERVRNLMESLSVEELDWRYRPDGWKIRQLVHHCTDSHMNSVIRFKLALTEDLPTIKPYLEDKWAELPDSDAPISISLSLLDGLHDRWTILLKSMSEDEFKRKLFHPEQGRELTLILMLGLYAWHCNHHLAHIKQALDAAGKYNRSS